MTAGKTAEQSRVNCIIIRLPLSVSEAIGKLFGRSQLLNKLV
ncbi:hypothetical protein [Oceanospirillum phage vB_OliS_GJ44]|nr:hypothetical protein [Oceanospirillum phage vB_OliS_GJ44]